MIRKSVLLVALMAIFFLPAKAQDPYAGWQTPPEEIMKVLHAPQLPWIWTAPTGEYLFLAEAYSYPTLAEMSAPMLKLAGKCGPTSCPLNCAAISSVAKHGHRRRPVTGGSDPLSVAMARLSASQPSASDREAGDGSVSMDIPRRASM